MLDCTMTIHFPFRKLGNPEFFRGSVFRYDQRYIERYMACLVREMMVNQRLHDKLHITRVYFQGCIPLMGHYNLTNLIRTIQAQFPIPEDCPFVFESEPGELTRELADLCADREGSELRLQYRTGSLLEAHALGLPASEEAMLPALRMIRLRGVSLWSLVLSDKRCNSSLERWQETLRLVREYAPPLIHLPGDTQEERRRIAVEILAKPMGSNSPGQVPLVYHLLHENTLVKEGVDYDQAADPVHNLGFGVGSLTVIPEGSFPNTMEISMYMAHPESQKSSIF